KKLATERVAAGDPWDEREYVMYPPAMKSPYGECPSPFGRARYSALRVARAPVGVWQGSRQRTRRRAGGLGSAYQGCHCELGLFRRTRCPVLLHRPRPSPAAMVGSRDVSADRDAPATRRGSAQLPADGVVAGSQDRRGYRVAAK